MSASDPSDVLAAAARSLRDEQDASKLQIFVHALNFRPQGVQTKVQLEVHVNGAASTADARKAAEAVANSTLTKCAWFGGDPNWGRIIDALGYSPAKIVEEKVDIGYSAPGSRKILWSLKRGQPTKTTFKALCAAVAPVWSYRFPRLRWLLARSA